MDSCSQTPSRRSRLGLDAFNFFMADVRTGVGPFVAIFLLDAHWNAAQIGVALTVAEIAGVLTQAPGGALLDHVRHKRAVLALAVTALAVSALAIERWPTGAVVATAQAVLGTTGSVFGPAVSAITLGLVAVECLGARTGRNGGFGAAGNVVAAVTMGWVGYHYSTSAIFALVGVLAVPALLSLLAIDPREIDHARARGADPGGPDGATRNAGLRALWRDRRVRVFLTLTILWHLGNGAMLATLGEQIGLARMRQSTLWMAAAVTVPQLVMIVLAPAVGALADRRGRKQVLVVGFLALPLRAVLCAVTTSPYLLIAYQVLDGVAAGIFGVVGVLMIADLTRGSGHFNFALGTTGAAVGVGAALSTTVAGLLVSWGGFPAAFAGLALFASAAAVVLIVAMPETGRFPGARGDDGRP